MIFPTFRLTRHGFGLPTGVRMIREHSAWLTRMLTTGSVGQGQPPRIPVRKVSAGGFAKLMSTPSGRYRAERWWEKTLEKLDD
jgi:hypothetical protein